MNCCGARVADECEFGRGDAGRTDSLCRMGSYPRYSPWGAKLATLKHGQHGKAPSKDGATLTADVSSLLNIGTKSIERAKQILESKHNPPAKAVETGGVSVSLASKLLAKCKDMRGIFFRCCIADLFK